MAKHQVISDSTYNEAINIDLEKGDEILGGRYRNKKSIVKSIGTDEIGQLTVNNKPALKFRISKLIPRKEVYLSKTPSKMIENKDLALKIKVLIDKVLIEAKTSKRVIKEGVLSRLEQVRHILGANIEDLYEDPKTGVISIELGPYGEADTWAIEEIEEQLGSIPGYDFNTAMGDDIPNAIVVNPKADLSPLKEIANLWSSLYDVDNAGDDSMDEATQLNEIEGTQLVPGTIYKVFNKENGLALYSFAKFIAHRDKGCEFELMNRPRLDHVILDTVKYTFVVNSMAPKLKKEANDHEVGMANGQLLDITKNASELTKKIGKIEKDLPGWIQDHISQAQNFLNQANTSYHELKESTIKDKALKIKVLLDKVLIEAKASKRVIKESDIDPIFEFVFSNEAYMGLSKEELESLVQRYKQEWEACKENYKGNIEAYFSELEANGDLLEETLDEEDEEEVDEFPYGPEYADEVARIARRRYLEYDGDDANNRPIFISGNENDTMEYTIDAEGNVWKHNGVTDIKIGKVKKNIDEVDVSSTEPQIEVGKSYRYDTAGGQSLIFTVKEINPESNEVTITKMTGRDIVGKSRLGYKQCNNALKNGSINLIESSKRLDEYSKATKDDSPRPSRMARPNIDGMTKSATAYWRHLYIQDEAEDILQDKFGNARGTKSFEGLLNAPRFGGFYQAVTQIVMQKAKMYQELGERLTGDYFDESWFSVWKRWMSSKNKTYEPKEEPKPAKVQDKISSLVKPVSSIAQTTSIPTPPVKRTTGYDSKDEMRIRDIMTYAKGDMSKAFQLARTMADKITDKQKAMRRANAAEDMNYHQISNIFLKRYITLGGK